MQQLLNWTLETIRDEESSFSWMEEYRYEWSPLVKSAVEQVINGKTVLVITDAKREWFGKYIIDAINDLSKNRPILPFYQLSNSFPNLEKLSTPQDLQILEDMLDISYPNGYYIWYIGDGKHPYTKLAYRLDDSFLWILDEEVQNSFTLRSLDEQLDIKLIQLFKLFEKTLFSSIFGELDLES